MSKFPYYEREKFPKGTKCENCGDDMGGLYECDFCGYYRFKTGGQAKSVRRFIADDPDANGSWSNAVKALEENR